ncbi:MAG: TonB-dependent receptor plug domain-containing protein, partial [Chitinophagaceae bacterium]|nr:TonB-dependent receptor plug domain-containing protein [Chitinophagaceae bacterium]
MQFTAALLLVFALSVSARTSSQTITLSGKDIPFQQVFSIIEKQAGYLVIGNSDRFNALDKVSVDVKNMEIPAFLELIFKDKPYDFEIKSKTIFIKEKLAITGDNSRLITPFIEPPPIKITGTVIGADNQPVAGANIIIKGTKRGITSDASGKFSIDANDGDVFIISSIGFNPKEIKIASSNTALIVVLEKSVSQLDEIQLIAYGQTSKRFQTGNISSVKSSDIEKAPVGNVLLALAGRVPGVFITQSTGVPGSGVSVQIQGQNSINNGNDPLYVVDGVPYPSKMLNSISSIQAGGNPLNFINPQDIESVDILKDADATAIYGSRAANGAILITTRKG